MSKSEGGKRKERVNKNPWSKLNYKQLKKRD